MRIFKLRKINDNLEKELRVLNTSFSKLLEKPKLRISFNAEEDSKELQGLQRQVEVYQKKITLIKNQLRSKTSYEKVINLENKCKEGERRNKELKEQVEVLEQIMKKQESEIEKLRESTQTSIKLQSLHEQLKKCREHNKELEKRMHMDNYGYQKQHTHLQNLLIKIQKLKEKKLKLKKGITDTSLDEHNNTKDTLTTSLNVLQKRLRSEKLMGVKRLNAIKAEIVKYQEKIKEAEKMQQLNIARLTDLRKRIKQCYLKSLTKESKNRGETSTGVITHAIPETNQEIDTKAHNEEKELNEPKEEVKIEEVKIEEAPIEVNEDAIKAIKDTSQLNKEEEDKTDNSVNKRRKKKKNVKMVDAEIDAREELINEHL